MENPNHAKELVKIIVKRATGRTLENFTVEAQKTFNGTDTDKHGICLDVLVKCSDAGNSVSSVYNIEPNTYYENDLAKRNRYYNALTDSKLLFSGDDFGTLPELISIWILSYDPFGDNRMSYSVKNFVTENPQLVYNDGVTTLYLNTKGKIGDNKDLFNLLNFLSNTNEKNAVDSELQGIQTIVNTIKGDSKVGERYMSMQTVMYYEKKMSYEEGEEHGIQLGEKRGIQLAEERLAKKLTELGVDPDIIKQAMEKDEA